MRTWRPSVAVVPAEAGDVAARAVEEAGGEDRRRRLGGGGEAAQPRLAGVDPAPQVRHVAARERLAQAA